MDALHDLNSRNLNSNNLKKAKLVMIATLCTPTTVV